MSISVVILLAAICFLVGVAFARLAAKSQSAALEERKNALERELVAIKAATDRQAAEIRALSEARSALDATLATERRSAEEKLQMLRDTSDQLKSQFKALAATALESNSANFLQ